ncbi:unnamed protein product, partial [Heterosigma akashiwo]
DWCSSWCCPFYPHRNSGEYCNQIPGPRAAGGPGEGPPLLRRRPRPGGAASYSSFLIVSSGKVVLRPSSGACSPYHLHSICCLDPCHCGLGQQGRGEGAADQG